MDLAQMSDGLQRLSKGRFALGLGSQIRPHIENRYSMPWTAPVPRMRELVAALKAIQVAWQERTPLDFRGEHYHHTLMTPFFDPGPNPYGTPPVWLAGLGPRMTRTAAESADGLLVHPFHSERYFSEAVVPAVEAGLAASGRPRDAFSLAATPIICTASTDEGRERAVKGVNVLLAFYGSTPAYRVTLDAHGWGDLQIELNRLTKQGRWDVIPTLIDDEVRETIAICGKPEEIGDLVAARYGSAVDRVGLSMPYDTPAETLAAVVAGLKAR
jgi:probable F420-dependent oxidoreductase